VVTDVEAVIDLALKHGGRQEGQTVRAEGKTQAAVRDPDGNTIELYSA
jgi:catechol 2,3-dioxygenase-like lactoylglutathione lyase family enzyme